MSYNTYIDHAGNECDARTGVPIGAPRRGAEPALNGSTGASGYVDCACCRTKRRYSFYGDGEESRGNDQKLSANFGRMVFVSEYD